MSRSTIDREQPRAAACPHGFEMASSDARNRVSRRPLQCGNGSELPCLSEITAYDIFVKIHPLEMGESDYRITLVKYHKEFLAPIDELTPLAIVYIAIPTKWPKTMPVPWFSFGEAVTTRVPQVAYPDILWRPSSLIAVIGGFPDPLQSFHSVINSKKPSAAAPAEAGTWIFVYEWSSSVGRCTVRPSGCKSATAASPREFSYRTDQNEDRTLLCAFLQYPVSDLVKAVNFKPNTGKLWDGGLEKVDGGLTYTSRVKRRAQRRSFSGCTEIPPDPKNALWDKSRSSCTSNMNIKLTK